MDFGRLTNVDHVDFALPADPPETLRVLGGQKRRRAPVVLIGTPRFADRGFLGKIYPRGTPPNRYLDEYARSFSAIELNSTYYGVRPEAIAHWCSLVPDTFRFCPKFPQEISHQKELRDADAETEAFFGAIAGFGRRLGPAWLVLPPSFGPRQLPSLIDYLARHAARGPMAIEFRHEGWFRDTGAWRDAMQVLEAHEVATIVTDVAGRRDAAHMRLTTSWAFVRFAGNRLHPTDFSRLDRWCERFVRWFGEGLRTLHLFLHQPDEHLCVELAEHVATRLFELGRIEVPRPRRVVSAVQGSLFDGPKAAAGDA